MLEATDAKGPEAKVDNSRLIKACEDKLRERASEFEILWRHGRAFFLRRDETKEDIGEAVGLKETHYIEFVTPQGRNLLSDGELDLEEFSSREQKNFVILYEDGTAKLVEYREETKELEKGEYDTKVRRHISPLTQEFSDALANTVEKAGPR